jgi:hypothetical protein
MNLDNFIKQLDQLHCESIVQWKEHSIELKHEGLLRLVEENHAFNFQLWLAEDRARRDDRGFEFVYQAKREIDHCNQQRNNRMEMIDEWLFHELNPAESTECPIHSESPGMMMDRLSILALKHYHMALQAIRTEVTDEHRRSCQHKLHIIELQQAQLLNCLRDFLCEIVDKKRTFKVYHQFKMYNDPTLNPQLYGDR